MPALGQRVAQLEGQMEDHGALMADIRSELRDLRTEMRADMKDLRTGIHGVDQKIDRHFMWVVGILIGVLSAIAGFAFQFARSFPL
jgi:hypothetical protein